MAEAKEVRHAGIGLDLSINGLDDFKRANSMMDDFLDTMKEASRITDKFKNNFSGFGGKSSDEVRKTRDAVQGVYHSMDNVIAISISLLYKVKSSWALIVSMSSAI